MDIFTALGAGPGRAPNQAPAGATGRGAGQDGRGGMSEDGPGFAADLAALDRQDGADSPEATAAAAPASPDREGRRGAGSTDAPAPDPAAAKAGRVAMSPAASRVEPEVAVPDRPAPAQASPAAAPHAVADLLLPRREGAASETMRAAGSASPSADALARAPDARGIAEPAAARAPSALAGVGNGEARAGGADAGPRPAGGPVAPPVPSLAAVPPAAGPAGNGEGVPADPSLPEGRRHAATSIVSPTPDSESGAIPGPRPAGVAGPADGPAVAPDPAAGGIARRREAPAAVSLPQERDGRATDLALPGRATPRAVPADPERVPVGTARPPAPDSADGSAARTASSGVASVPPAKAASAESATPVEQRPPVSGPAAAMAKAGEAAPVTSFNRGADTTRAEHGPETGRTSAAGSPTESPPVRVRAAQAPEAQIATPGPAPGAAQRPGRNGIPWRPEGQGARVETAGAPPAATRPEDGLRAAAPPPVEGGRLPPQTAETSDRSFINRAGTVPATEVLPQRRAPAATGPAAAPSPGTSEAVVQPDASPAAVTGRAGERGASADPPSELLPSRQTGREGGGAPAPATATTPQPQAARPADPAGPATPSMPLRIDAGDPALATRGSASGAGPGSPSASAGEAGSLPVSQAQGGSGPSGPAPATAPMQPAEAARTVLPQIAAALRTAPRLGEVEIHLDPPELGRVRIGLEIADSGLKASLIAERPATGELLRTNGGILAQQLQEAGFTDIDLQFGAPQQDPGGHGGAPGGHGEGGRDPRPADPSGGIARAGPAHPGEGADGIDLRL